MDLLKKGKEGCFLPIKLPKLLPAREILENENIFIMDDERAKRARHPSIKYCDFEFNA